MFPYPSGSGLHVGHVEGYTATDILSRHKRKQGYNVLHPMGWDSFGLPAEQYAVRTGTHPAITTKKNIDNFRRQLQALGFSYDWDRELATSDPKYYKWTQWIFTKLFEQGLAYEAEFLVNYCPKLGTVLANEEIEEGRSVIGGFPVERRPLKQWVLKITSYAERLLEDLDELEWPESVKKLQRNWIGKSEGAMAHFVEEKTRETFSIYTTTPQTLFGVTYVVFSPEHPLVNRITTPEHKAVVDEYKKEAARKSDIIRTDLNKEKTGVFTGAYAINPVTDEKVPIWVADYVLMGYGTGAIMAVPAHDERDFDFAKEYDLPIRIVVDPDTEDQELHQNVLTAKTCWMGKGTMIHCTHNGFSLNELPFDQAKEATIHWLEEKGRGYRSTQYKLRDWLFSRQRYWGEPFPLLKFADGTMRPLGLDELPLIPPDLNDFAPAGDGKSPLAKERHWVEVTDPVTGKPALRETDTMPQWAGSCWYYLRFCDPHNETEAWSSQTEQYLMPVDLYVGGVEHAVLHLLYARFWHKVLYDCGYVHTKEPFPCLRNQGLIVARSYQDAHHAYVDPIDVIQKGNDYYHKKTGEKLHSQIEKMSKSKLNGITPDDVIEEFGADSLRLYEMFMGPLEKEKVWSTNAVSGCRRFLNRFFALATSPKLSNETSTEATKLGHRLVHGVLKDVEALQFNTAIAKMMEFINDFSPLPTYPRDVLLMATHVLNPFAPHIAEEIWEILGGQGELSYTPYPKVDPTYLEDDTITYVVQVNGRLRSRMELPKNAPKDEILALAQQDPAVSRHTNGQTIAKVVFVPNKILNIVVN